MTMYRLNSVPANIRALPILQSADSVSINQWDEQWEVYGSGATARIGSKNPIPCVGGRTYYLTSTPAYGWKFYDVEGNVVLTYYNKTCTAPNNAVYMMFQLDDTYGTVYNHDVSLNYPSTDTAYHAYKNHIATFDTDRTDNLYSCLCTIQYQQAIGVPSPTNPLPITTYTEMNVSHSGVNMWNGKFVDTTFTESNTFSSTYQFAGNHAMPIKSGQQYCAMINGTQTSIRYVFLDKNQNVIGSFVNGDYTNVAPSNAYYLQWRTRTALTTGTEHCQIEKGTTATTYEPFNGTTANIPFGQTVANGVIDIATGKLRIDKNKVTVGTSGWSKYTEFFLKNFSDKQRTTMSDEYPIVCSMLENGGTIRASSQMSDTHIYQFSTNDNIYIYDSSCADETAFYNKYSACEILYQLATPIEIQLDSTQITALLNENNIWCDTGDTEVKYWMSINKYIGQ